MSCASSCFTRPTVFPTDFHLHQVLISGLPPPTARPSSSLSAAVLDLGDAEGLLTMQPPAGWSGQAKDTALYLSFLTLVGRGGGFPLSSSLLSCLKHRGWQNHIVFFFPSPIFKNMYRSPTPLLQPPQVRPRLMPLDEDSQQLSSLPLWAVGPSGQSRAVYLHNCSLIMPATDFVQVLGLGFGSLLYHLMVM